MGNSPVFRFDSFSFRSRTCELFRDGREVTLERQPARVLRRLLESAGQTVTRQELIEAVWGTETSVSFDDGLNYCVRQLRIALGDDARASRFIVTAPRRGYRFIAQIESLAPVTTDPVRWRTGWWPAVAALLILVTIVMEARPNQHHEMTLRAARLVHDALF